MPKKPNSYILHERQDLVVIGTGFAKASNNGKTGDMVQIWILRKDQKPTDALKTGADETVCGICPLRPDRNTGKRGCYVPMRGPNSVWRKYNRGGYGRLTEDQIGQAFAGKKARFGAYGEPVLLPLPLVRKIAEASAGWTGYTHQWRKAALQGYRQYFMASTNSSDRYQAQALGWRTFSVESQSNPEDMLCPASHEFEQKRGFKLSCENCGQCAGLARGGRSVTIPPHGVGAKYAN